MEPLDGFVHVINASNTSFVSQLTSAAVPQHFWRVLNEKLEANVLDAGAAFSIQLEYEGCESEDENSELEVCEREDVVQNTKSRVVVIKEDGISPEDPTQIYLIDHAWTYHLGVVHQSLKETPGLLHRMAKLMNIPMANRLEDDMIEDIFNEMWRYNQTYTFGPTTQDDRALPYWYIMDEFGSSVQHSDDPTFRTVPLWYVPQQMAYSILFPIKKVAYGEEVTRNYIEDCSVDVLVRNALKIPWSPCDMTFVNCVQTEPHADFIRSGRIEETLPENTDNVPEIPKNRKVKVYSSVEIIREHLKHPAFEIVTSESDADVLWYSYHFKNFRDFSIYSPNKFINQFPFEHILTVKDLLPVICRRAAPEGKLLDLETLETNPKWLPTTYNLQTELPQFVSYFQRRQQKGLENYWICKPWNLARSFDTYITNNLNCIIRLRSTGPKVACKYISDPVLFPADGMLVKFDIRYIILLTSVQPLKLYAYDRFWVRFANKPFSLDSFEEYTKHFTVMNYNEALLRQMFCHDFIAQFENYYNNFKWKDIEKEIFAILKSVFEAAVKKNPPVGFCHSPQSRAMYGVDMMLAWNREKDDAPKMQPMLLEINWAPDCQRACQYYPEFFDIFSLLFLNDEECKHVVLL